MEKEYPGNKMPETVPMMLRNVAKDNAERIAVAYKENSTGIFLLDLFESQCDKVSDVISCS